MIRIVECQALEWIVAESFVLLKPQIITHEPQIHAACRTVALFADNDLGFVRLWISLFIGYTVHLRPIEKRDDVSVLLDAAALAQIGELRPPVRPGLDRARQLRTGDNRQVQFLGQRFERSRNTRDFLFPVVRSR